MFRKFHFWYTELTLLQQLSISFLTNWIFWFIASIIGEKINFYEERTLGSHIFYVTWMAFFMTTFNNWRKVKLLFKGKSKQKSFEDSNRNLTN